MPARMSYRRVIKPKYKKPKYYRKQGLSIHTYRDENGIEHHKITKYIKWGKYEDVNRSEENQQMVQDSIEEGS